VAGRVLLAHLSLPGELDARSEPLVRVRGRNVDARFHDARSSGERVETRPCTLTFVK
jgi:hypothetical protein